MPDDQEIDPRPAARAVVLRLQRLLAKADGAGEAAADARRRLVAVLERLSPSDFEKQAKTEEKIRRGRELLRIFELARPRLADLKARLRAYGVSPDARIEDLRQDLREARAEEVLDALLGTWDRADLASLLRTEPAAWLYDRLARVSGMTRDQVRRALQRARHQRKRKWRRR